MIFGPSHYVPILKVKSGEKEALKIVGKVLGSQITPLLEIVERKPEKAIAAHIDTTFEDLAEAAQLFSRCLLDARAMAPDGPSAATAVFQRASAEGIVFTPVTGLSRREDVAAALAHSSTGVAIRLTRKEFESGQISQGLLDFMAHHRLVHARVDIIIDLGPIDELVSDGVTELLTSFMADVPDQTRWRTLTVSASAFPASMGVVERNSHRRIERNDWKAWRDSLYANRQSLARLPTYSDYAIQHPKGVEGFDHRKMRVSAAIRYTLGEDWLLIKGESTGNVNPSDQFPGLAKRLVYGHLRPSFVGITHCRGCALMKAAANGASSMGSAGVWRRLGTIHHLTVVAQTLNSLPWP